MPANKQHHFLPQFLLRNFSGPKSRKLVNVFNIRQSKIVPDAPLRGQCHRNYLYGNEPDVERILQQIEAHMSVIASRSIATNRCPEKKRIVPPTGPSDPPPLEEKYRHLFYFVGAQIARTLGAINEREIMIDGITRHLLKQQFPERSDFIDKLHVSWGGNATLPVLDAILSSIHLWDLNLKLLVAPAASELIIADDPVLRFNQYFRSAATAFRKALRLSGYRYYSRSDLNMRFFCTTAPSTRRARRTRMKFR